MNIDELLALKRPLTPSEMAAVEDELLKLAQQLQQEVARVAEELGPEGGAEVEQLQQAAARTLSSIEAAIAIPMVPVATGDARKA